MRKNLKTKLSNKFNRTLQSYCSIVGILFGGLFIYTAWHKISDKTLFIYSIVKGGFIQESAIDILYWGIIILEVLIAFLLLLSYRIGFFLASISFVAFTIYIYILKNYYVYSECSCGGILNNLPYNIHISINVLSFFLLVSAFAIKNHDH
ncbi:hypothetical protein GCM10009120_27170 [Sphingobacterium siyangense subsp. cladoniae]|uniref:MauE/DoxX family redox-associated membrane protein n=1 Tax=Sphingobacterium siyangense TaxID=459529 RepID=UPI0031F8F9BC